MAENMTSEELVDLSEDVVYSQMEVEDSDNPHVLCKFKGIFMGPFNEQNENGRDYSVEAIEKKILEDKDVQFSLNNKTLLGEAHHPLNRTSIWFDESCICTRKLWLTEDKNYLLGEADVLNTPKGKILDTLLRYGSRIGVSARAKGKTVRVGTKNVVRPENYLFKTFDVVLNPGFDKARPEPTEANGRPLEKEGKISSPTYVSEEVRLDEEGLVEEFSKLLNEAKDYEKEAILEYIEYSGSDKLKALVPMFESKDTTEIQSEPTESEGDNKQAEESIKIENLESLVESKDREITSLRTYVNNLISDIKHYQDISEELDDAIERADKLEKLTEDLKELVEVADEEILSLEGELKGAMDIRFRLQEANDRLEENISECKAENQQLLEEQKVLTQLTDEQADKLSSMEEELFALKDQIVEERHSLLSKESTNKRLEEELQTMSGIVDGLSSDLVKANEQIHELSEEKELNTKSSKRRESVDYFTKAVTAVSLNEEAEDKKEKVDSNNRRRFIANIGGQNYG